MCFKAMFRFLLKITYYQLNNRFFVFSHFFMCFDLDRSRQIQIDLDRSRQVQIDLGRYRQIQVDIDRSRQIDRDSKYILPGYIYHDPDSDIQAQIRPSVQLYHHSVDVPPIRYTEYSCTIIQNMYRLYSVQYTVVPSFRTCTTCTVYSIHLYHHSVHHLYSIQNTAVPLFRTCTVYTVYSKQFQHHSVHVPPVQCTVYDIDLW